MILPSTSSLAAGCDGLVLIAGDRPGQIAQQRNAVEVGLEIAEVVVRTRVGFGILQANAAAIDRHPFAGAKQRDAVLIERRRALARRSVGRDFAVGFQADVPPLRIGHQHHPHPRRREAVAADVRP